METAELIDESSEINLIPIQLIPLSRRDEAMISHNHPNMQNFGRGNKYYKQTYRPAWEEMPDFRGWLRGIEGQPTRAYCTYCEKSLHAHRLSLLKHTCTIRHQRAAQCHKNKQKNMLINKKIQQQSHKVTTSSKDDNMAKVYKDTMELTDFEEVGKIESHIVTIHADEQVVENNITVAEEPTQIVEISDTHTQLENAIETVVAASEHDEDDDLEDVEFVDDDDDDDSDNFDDDDDADDENGRSETASRRRFTVHKNNPNPPISSQVTDTTRGVPVPGLSVSLYKLIDGRWTYINEATTNARGRVSLFRSRADFTPGRYKLHYDVDRYFESQKMDSIYPFIEIVFDCAFSESYHIPVLLNPYGYSTYRGT